jgi:flagellar assembly factor FliW
MLSNLNGKIINLSNSLLGFEQISRFLVQEVEEGSIYAFLNGIEDEKIGFIVSSPFNFFNDFAFELTETIMKDMDISSENDVLVLGIITLNDSFDESSMNLLAPIIINLNNLEARQIVLPSKYNYNTKTPLYKETNIEEGE